MTVPQMSQEASTTTTIGDHSCTIIALPNPSFLLIQPVDSHEMSSLQEECEHLQSLTSQSFALVAFMVNDWFTELSPWKAPAAFGGKQFGDAAPLTLNYLFEQLLPTINTTYASAIHLIGGYSLAGLFALWASYQTDIFYGVAAASPSLWFRGWMDYARKEKCQASTVYLSLGDQEDKTRNQMLSQAGYCIREQAELLSTQRCQLEWNHGGHFMDVPFRIARGFAWLMNEFANF